jgi:hypothetical protein
MRLTCVEVWLTARPNSARRLADGEVSYSIEQNTGAERQGAITIGGQVHTIQQQAGS